MNGTMSAVRPVRKKRRRVKEAELRVDEKAEHLGLTRIDPEPERTPAEQLALEIINDPSMHSHGSDIQWWQLPHTIAVGKVKAEATRNKWQHGRIIDGKRARFQSIAFREKNRDTWGVAIAYDPDKQPKPRTYSSGTEHDSKTEALVPESDTKMDREQKDEKDPRYRTDNPIARWLHGLLSERGNHEFVKIVYAEAAKQGWSAYTVRKSYLDAGVRQTFEPIQSGRSILYIANEDEYKGKDAERIRSGATTEELAKEWSLKISR